MKSLIDEQQTQRINEVAKKFSEALVNSYQALTNRAVSTQEPGAQLTQEFFEAVIDNLRAQAQSNQGMVEELVDQQQQQRKTAQTLAQETVEGHMRLLDYMFSYYRLLIARVRTHLPSQKMTVEAMQMALKNVWAQRSQRRARRRQSLSFANMFSTL